MALNQDTAELLRAIESSTFVRARKRCEEEREMLWWLPRSAKSPEHVLLDKHLGAMIRVLVDDVIPQLRRYQKSIAKLAQISTTTTTYSHLSAANVARWSDHDVLSTISASHFRASLLLVRAEIKALENVTDSQSRKLRDSLENHAKILASGVDVIHAMAKFDECAQKLAAYEPLRVELRNGVKCG